MLSIGVIRCYIYVKLVLCKDCVYLGLVLFHRLNYGKPIGIIFSRQNSYYSSLLIRFVFLYIDNKSIVVFFLYFKN